MYTISSIQTPERQRRTMAYDNKDLSEYARARDWLGMAQAKWRLQTMQHRSRYNPRTGEYRQLPTRIRRFLNGTPVGIKTAVLAMLKESAPYKSPVFDCELDEGLLYRPTNTFLRKDGPEHTTGGKDPTYTIIQDLLLDDGLGDTFSFGDESGCAQVGETEYHWDEPSVADCPDGAQGVSYQVTDVNRDRETDLFSYRVRKVQALTVHVPPHVDECDARRRVTTESWDNVYGEPGAFRWDSVRGGGGPITPPSACGQPQGRTVKVDVYRNPDCTYRVTVQTVEAVTDPGLQYSIYRDQYKVNWSERVLNAFAPLPRAGVEYGGGVTTRYTSEHNEDGTWTNSTEVETERPVPLSTEETRRTPRGVLRQHVDTNQVTPASGIATRFGSWKYTKTPGGLFTNEYTEYTRTHADNLGLVCSDTAFMKTHESQSSVESVPASGHVPPAADGLVTTWNYDTDAEGFVTRRVRTEQEHEVEYAVRRRTWGWLGTTEGYQHRSLPEAAAMELYNGGSRGSSVELKLTNGGMYDVDVQSFRRVAGQALGFECAKTVYQHRHESAASADGVGAEADEAGGGHTYRRSFAVDPTTGAVTRRDEDTTELHVPESRRSVRVTARGTVVRTTSANAPGRPGDASSAGSETEWELTPGGRYNVTTTTTSPRAGASLEECSRDLFLHTHTRGRTEGSAAQGHVEATADLSGAYRARRQQLGDDGLWSVNDTETQEQRVVAQRVEERVTRHGLVRRTTDVQTTSEGQAPGATVADVGRERIVEKTRGGRRNLTTTSVTAITGTTDESCEKTAFLHVHNTTDLRQSKAAGHVDDAADGVYGAESWTLTDAGTWERRGSVNTECQPDLKIQKYRDAFGESTVTEEFSHASNDGGQGGREFDAERLIRSVEATMTNGRRYNVRTREETPTEVDSGWLHFEKTTTEGRGLFYDFIVFRNAKLSQVRDWMEHIRTINYSGWRGAFDNHPSINISPNKFRLWDGSIGITTGFTPKGWAGGGNVPSDSFEDEYTLKDVQVSVLRVDGEDAGDVLLLECTTEETHLRGAGVGKDRFRDRVRPGATLLRGSQFSYNPAGQSFTYDLVTDRRQSFRVIHGDDTLADAQ